MFIFICFLNSSQPGKSMSHDSCRELSLCNPGFYTVKTDLPAEEAVWPSEGTLFFFCCCFPRLNTLKRAWESDGLDGEWSSTWNSLQPRRNSAALNTEIRHQHLRGKGVKVLILPPKRTPGLTFTSAAQCQSRSSNHQNSSIKAERKSDAPGEPWETVPSLSQIPPGPDPWQCVRWGRLSKDPPASGA